MATASVTNLFVDSTAAEAAQVNTNFADLVTFLNNSVIHKDGTKAMTAAFDAGTQKIVNLVAGVASTDAVNKAQLDAVGTMPVGGVTAYAGATAPTGFVLCDGAAISRATYAGLYAIVGTTYGAGDGVNTFNVPDLRSRFIAGKGTAGWSDALAEAGGSKDAVAVAHTHAHTHAITHDHGSFSSSADGTHFHTYSNAAGALAAGIAGGATFAGTVSNTSSDGSHQRRTIPIIQLRRQRLNPQPVIGGRNVGLPEETGRSQLCIIHHSLKTATQRDTATQTEIKIETIRRLILLQPLSLRRQVQTARKIGPILRLVRSNHISLPRSASPNQNTTSAMTGTGPHQKSWDQQTTHWYATPSQSADSHPH